MSLEVKVFSTLAAFEPSLVQSYLIPIYSSHLLSQISFEEQDKNILSAFCFGIFIKIKIDLVLSDLKSHKIKLNCIRVCGGVSKSDFLCQYLANLLNFPIERSNFSYTSSTCGAAFLAGLGVNIFHKLEDLNSIREVTETFKPNESNNDYDFEIDQWKNAVKRFVNWNMQPS